MYNEHDSLTFKHKITLDRLTCHKNQSTSNQRLIREDNKEKETGL